MSAATKRKCRNPQCCTYNLVVTTEISRCLGCGGDLNSIYWFAGVDSLGDVFGFGGLFSKGGKP